MPFTPKNWIDEANHAGPPASPPGTPLSAAAMEDLETRVTQDIWVGREWLMPTGVAATDTANLRSALASGAHQIHLGGTIDFALNGAGTVTTAGQAIIGGGMTAGEHRCLYVNAADVTVQNVNFTRGTAQSISDAAALQAGVAVNGVRFRSIDCNYTDAALNCLHFNPSVCDDSYVRGGYFQNSSARQAASLITAYADNTNHNTGIKISGITGESTGCPMGIVLYDSKRCQVIDNRVFGMQELPRTALTGWTNQGGGVFRATDRTDGITRVLFQDTTQLTENTATPTTPAEGEWGISGGYVYTHLAGDVDPDTIGGAGMQSRILSGYGIHVYNTDTDVQIVDNLIAHNEIVDCEGFGIYLKIDSVGCEGNKTSHNLLRNVCTVGTQTVSLPFGGIGVAAGTDTMISGDSIDGNNSQNVPLIHAANTGTGKIQGCDLRGGGGEGIYIPNGTWQVSGCRASGNTGTGFYLSAGVTITDCVADNAALDTKIYDGMQHWAAGGTPVSTVTARIGSFYRDTTGGTAYMKNTGTDTSGWVSI